MGWGVFVSKTTQYDGGGGGLDQIRQNTTRGGGGVKKSRKSYEVVYGWPLIILEFYKVITSSI